MAETVEASGPPDTVPPATTPTSPSESLLPQYTRLEAGVGHPAENADLSAALDRLATEPPNRASIVETSASGTTIRHIERDPTTGALEIVTRHSSGYEGREIVDYLGRSWYVVNQDGVWVRAFFLYDSSFSNGSQLAEGLLTPELASVATVSPSTHLLQFDDGMVVRSFELTVPASAVGLPSPWVTPSFDLGRDLTVNVLVDELNVVREIQFVGNLPAAPTVVVQRLRYSVDVPVVTLPDPSEFIESDY